MKEIIEEIRFLKSKERLLDAKELAIRHLIDSPNNSFLLYEIGDILRLEKSYKESAYFFKKAVDTDTSVFRHLKNEHSFERIIFHDLRGCLMKLRSEIFRIKENSNFNERNNKSINSAMDTLSEANNLIRMADYRN